MDLFVVERYEGDTKPETEVSTDKSSHLQRLLSKIENRKLQAETLAREQEERRKKIKKKQKPQNEKPPELNENQDGSKQSTSKSKKKGKKTKKSNDLETDIAGKFTVIGSKFCGVRKSQVKAQLPHWLANPSIVTVDMQNLTVTIDDIPLLDRDIKEKLRENGITHFFPVQHQVIPCLLEAQKKPPQFWPRDVCVSAPTGSGKTFAFVLPIIQALRHRLVPHIRALVVLPVQELATQVYKVFLDYIGVTNLRVVCITGKESFQQEQTQLVRYSEANGQFHSCADIVVTTPGRLVDHLQSTEGFSLHHLKYLIIDEADRVMETMQNDWLYHLDKHISTDDSRRVPPLTVNEMSIRYPPPQKLLFSATLSEDPEKLQQLGLFQPRLFTSIVKRENSDDSSNTLDFVGKFTTPAELSEYWVSCDLALKPLFLYHLILERNCNTILVFTNTIDGVHRLAILMKQLLNDKSVSEVSSALLPKQRKQVFEDFASGKTNVLICSDALARGIDVPNIDCVISYDAPKFIKNYIHRVGRTGRAGRKGTAITLIEERQKNKFEAMLSHAGKQDTVKEMPVDISSLEPLEDDYRNALAALKTTLEQEDDLKKKVRMKPKKKAKKFMHFSKRKLQGVVKQSIGTTKKIKMSKKIKKLSKGKLL